MSLSYFLLDSQDLQEPNKQGVSQTVAAELLAKVSTVLYL